MKLINMLLQNGVIPVVVFDGQDVPIKAKENEMRAKYVIWIEKTNKKTERRETGKSTPIGKRGKCPRGSLLL